jgi:hypothetical protein
MYFQIKNTFKKQSYYNIKHAMKAFKFVSYLE